MPLLPGTTVAQTLLAEVEMTIRQAKLRPGLAVILVGDYIESHKYVALKEARAKEIGVYFEKHFFPDSVSADELFALIDTLNSRSDIHGILIQLPLPLGLPTDELIGKLLPAKDVDGFHMVTVNHFLAGDRAACPVFPLAVWELIHATHEKLQGERGIAVVNSVLLGEVFAQSLRLEGMEGEYVLRSAGPEAIATATRGARVVITACGIPDLITADMVSSKAIVIDGGNVHVNGKVRGDVDRDLVLHKVAWLSPVPGGVGPVTIACLLKRVTLAAIAQRVAR